MTWRCSGSARTASVVWMLCGETALRDESGRPTMLLHRYSDYTDRHEDLNALRRSEEALEDQMRQDRLMQAVASAANEAASLADVLSRARDLVLLHDDWQRARAFVPASAEPGGPARWCRSTRPTRTGRRMSTTRSRLATSSSPSSASTHATPGLGRAPADLRLPGAPGRRGLRRRRDHLGAAAVALRAHRADGRPRGRAAGSGGGARARPGAARAGTRRGHGRLAAEVGVPRHDEPRDPDAAQRCHRPQRPAAAHDAHAGAAAARHRRAGRQPDPARHHQRHPGLLEDRGRAAGARASRLRGADPAGARHDHARRDGAEQGPRPDGGLRPVPASRAVRRPDEARRRSSPTWSRTP